MCKVFGIYNRMDKKYVLFTRSEDRAYNMCKSRYVLEIHSYGLDTLDVDKVVYTNTEKFKQEYLK